MKITKIGHCCLVIEEGDVKLMTDPGIWSSGQDEESGVDAVLITHEHVDHLHVESLKEVLDNNKNAKVISNSSVGKILEKEGIEFEVVEDGDLTGVGGVSVEGHGDKHESIRNFPPIDVQNTGYFIGGRLYYPGDSFHKIGKPVDILALPVSAPWLKIQDSVDFALDIKPKHAFPVHDGMIMEGRYSGAHAVPAKLLPENNIDFLVLENGQSLEL